MWHVVVTVVILVRWRSVCRNDFWVKSHLEAHSLANSAPGHDFALRKGHRDIVMWREELRGILSQDDWESQLQDIISAGQNIDILRRPLQTQPYMSSVSSAAVFTLDLSSFHDARLPRSLDILFPSSLRYSRKKPHCHCEPVRATMCRQTAQVGRRLNHLVLKDPVSRGPIPPSVRHVISRIRPKTRLLTIDSISLNSCCKSAFAESFFVRKAGLQFLG